MTQEALKLALEGVEIHSPNSPEYIVCAALIEALRENAMREVQRLGQEIEQEQKLIGTVGDLFDDRVIAHRKLDRDLLVYIKEKNT